MSKICFSTGGDNVYSSDFESLIELHQNSYTQFSVVYGAQVKNNLTYREAAKELGECIMHMAACNGDLYN